MPRSLLLWDESEVLSLIFYAVKMASTRQFRKRAPEVARLRGCAVSLSMASVSMLKSRHPNTPPVSSFVGIGHTNEVRVGFEQFRTRPRALEVNVLGCRRDRYEGQRTTGSRVGCGGP